MNIEKYITLDDIKKKKKYKQFVDYDEYVLNCHIGHRKLLCVVLEFLTICQKKINTDDCLVLYIGAAPFISYNVLHHLYPKTKWIVYDTNKFIFDKPYKNVEIKNQYFTDNDINIVKKIFENDDKKHLLYINDMRINPGEIDVLNDMRKQEQWIMDLNPFASSVKFRLPYYKMEENKDLENILYLDGKVYLQTYAPKRSTETRLISFSPYKFKNYNLKDYEEKLVYFNEILRTKDFYYQDSDKYLFLHYYDNVREYYIFKKYNELNKKFNNMFEMYNFVDEKLDNYQIKNGVNCKLQAFYYYIKLLFNSNLKKEKKQKEFSKIINNFKKILKKINNLEKKHKDNYKKFKLDINDNYLKLKNNKIELNKDYIQKMYNDL